jgi:translation initiation factor IF-2
MSVGEFAQAIGKPIAEVITTLVRFGVMAAVNQDIDFETMTIVADELGVTVAEEEVKKDESATFVLSEAATTRPPVVTIMGHVDHGKTTLLDMIRHTNVAAGEAGGITQAISSYQVLVSDPDDEKKQRLVTFVDTPGHSAFEAMRQHGAAITDLVVLVVAANEGVKPQTKEAIKHTRALNVPIIVALNKSDLPDANPERVKRELSDLDLLPEEWGGTIPVISISAKTGDNVERLLEVILLATDLMELKADNDAPVTGVVVESHMEAGLGPVATVLIQNGTLKVGDMVVLGEAWGRIRLIEDHRGKRIRLATASQPVRISGLSSVPEFGVRLKPVADDKQAREMARQAGTGAAQALRQRSEELAGTATENEGRRELAIVLKADTQGSLNAITEILTKLNNEDVVVAIVKSGVGDISDGDVQSASAAHGSIINFNTKCPPNVRKIAQERGVVVQSFAVIYELEQAVSQAVDELMPLVEVEEEVGRLVVLLRFHDNRKRPVLGGSVTLGELKRGAAVKVTRGEKVIAHGQIAQVRRGKQIVDVAKNGTECGLELNIHDGDQTEIAPKDYVSAIQITKVKKSML